MTLFAVTEGVAFVWDPCPYSLCTQTWIAQGLPLQPDLLGNPRSDANCHMHQAVDRDMRNRVNSAEDKKNTHIHTRNLLCYACACLLVWVIGMCCNSGMKYCHLLV